MRKALYLFIVVSVVSVGVGYYMFNMPPKNLSKVKSEVSLSAHELMSSFEEDEQSANTAYLGKVIEVRGIVSNVAFNEDGSAQLILETQSMMGGISCNFSIEDAARYTEVMREGQNTLVKGMCTGYLMDVVLERCVIIKSNK